MVALLLPKKTNRYGSARACQARQPLSFPNSVGERSRSSPGRLGTAPSA